MELMAATPFRRSPVYEWSDGQFRLLQTVDTQQATDVAFLEVQSINYLIITGLPILPFMLLC